MNLQCFSLYNVQTHFKLQGFKFVTPLVTHSLMGASSGKVHFGEGINVRPTLDARGTVIFSVNYTMINFALIVRAMLKFRRTFDCK